MILGEKGIRTTCEPETKSQMSARVFCCRAATSAALPSPRSTRLTAAAGGGGRGCAIFPRSAATGGRAAARAASRADAHRSRSSSIGATDKSDNAWGEWSHVFRISTSLPPRAEARFFVCRVLTKRCSSDTTGTVIKHSAGQPALAAEDQGADVPVSF